MGNGIGYERQDLRDRDAELSIPQNVSRVISNFILAMLHDTYFPCIILRPSVCIPEGYAVYFFHLKQETEVPAYNIIGNLWTLINCEISFVDSLGNICTGRVVRTDFKRSETLEQPINFFVYSNNNSGWVSFPYIFMTRQQARLLCC
ncbi:uncharacterized protein LOC130900123 [Diorhabda carinulata]|uniref:uncharacterized protein LOC130900123 n=1 Tax=Diorhabda carinulata TaxID=1163345 RepID=UPI0025A2D4A5|nr:uncharacterized protein LOC130900123 [Diorhabda carinulata]